MMDSSDIDILKSLPKPAFKAAEWCLKNQDYLHAFLIRLIKAYSPSYLGWEKGCMDLVREELIKIGGAGEIAEIKVSRAELTSHPSYVDIASMGLPDYSNRSNLATAFNAGLISEKKIAIEDFCKEKPLHGSIILNGHVDVVELNEKRWTRKQGEIAEGRIFGRGSVDMKGGLAAMIFVLKAFRETGTPLAMPVLLEAVVDEESGGNGTLMNRIRGIKAEKALIPEPTSTSCCCPAGVGAHFFELTLTDPNAKAIEQQFETTNLIEYVSEYAKLVQLYAEKRQKEITHPLFEVYELINQPKASSAICKIQGGDWPSTMPAEIKMQGTVECIPGENLAEMRSDFENHLKTKTTEKNLPEYTIRWFGLRFPPSTIDPQHPWVQNVVRAAHPIVSRNPSFKEGPLIAGAGGSDLRLFHEFDIPAVLYGPAGDNSHGTDEYVETRELMDFCLIMTNLLSGG